MGEIITATLGYSWDLKKDTLPSTMEPAFISKKCGMSRNAQLSDSYNNDKLITECGLAVLCASIVSTDGILSVPLQLGAKLLLSCASLISPGMENWNLPIVEVDTGFASDVCKYVRLIEHFKDLTPVDRKLVKLNEKVVGVVVLHDASISALGVLIYLLVQADAGRKHLRITKAST